MGVDTKGFVLTSDKDVFRVARLITSALDKLIVDEKHLFYPDRVAFLSEEARTEFKSCVVGLSVFIETLVIDFTFRGQVRSLKVFFTCDCDQKEYGPKSLSMTLGCSGHSALFIQTALHALSLLGQPYFDENDCDGIDAAPLAEKPVTVLAAIKLGYICEGRLSDWVQDYDSGAVGQGKPFNEFFGASRPAVAELLAVAEYDARCQGIKAVAEALPDYPKFLSNYHEECAGAV